MSDVVGIQGLVRGPSAEAVSGLGFRVTTFLHLEQASRGNTNGGAVFAESGSFAVCRARRHHRPP